MAQGWPARPGRSGRDHWYFALSRRDFENLAGCGADLHCAGCLVRLVAAPLVPELLSVHSHAGILCNSSFRQSCSGRLLFFNPDSAGVDHARVWEGLSSAKIAARPANVLASSQTGWFTGQHVLTSLSRRKPKQNSARILPRYHSGDSSRSLSRVA